MVSLASPAFDLAERGRGVGGEIGAGAATNAARQPAGAAGPARGEAHHGSRVVKSPWQPRDDKRSRERGRGTPAAG